MKRALCYLIAIIFSILSLHPLSVQVQAKQKNTAEFDESQLYARSAVLMDADSGRILVGKDAANPMPMASTTKIMTCILTLENAQMDDLVSVSAYAAKMPEVKLHIIEGEQYKLNDLLHSLMLESHNDAAVAIAEHVAGTVEGFAAMMNEKAKQLGCMDTFFITPNGLDASAQVTNTDGTGSTKVHSTTAADLARIMSYCITQSPQKEAFLKITRAQSHTFQNYVQESDGTVKPGSRSFTCVNHNAFLHMMDGALTGKTGFTGNAGYCYVGALKSRGRTFVIALLACGWPNNKTYKWKDARKLFQYGIDYYEQKDITNYEYQPNPVPVVNGAGKDRLLKTKMQLRLTVKQQEQKVLLSESDSVQVRAELPKLLAAPIKEGTKVGSLNYYINGELTAQMPVLAAQDIEKRSLRWYFMLVLSRYFYPYF
ncbi:MAG: D-alanyl-D-alanine carboxypeptidase [Eubacterium sp.]|nr:D-alanyl-D-alanine carboxypeptidase [Eubacterium sp.]